MPKSKGRKVRKAGGKQKPVRGAFTPIQDDKYLSVDDGPLCFVYKITGTVEHKADNSLEIKSIPVEDTIRPVELKFEPPLQSDGTDSTCFDYQWQQLTYLFDLDNPAEFVSVFDALNEDDKTLLVRYVTTCRNLAGYSVINSKNAFSLSSERVGDWTVKVDLPSHQEFSGFSATFRQLHNDGEDASFVKAWNIINKALNETTIDGDGLAAARLTMKGWKKARARLQEKAAATLICEQLNPKLPDNAPRTLKGVVPEDLIKAHNYGDTLHWGDQREALAELTNDPFHANFYKFCCEATMTSLSHVYFGFAVLVAAALDVRDSHHLSNAD